MLLNEFLEERRKHLEQQATISRLEKRIEAVAAGLQEVSVHVRLNRSANVPNGYSVSRHRRGFGGRQSLLIVLATADSAAATESACASGELFLQAAQIFPKLPVVKRI